MPLQLEDAGTEAEHSIAEYLLMLMKGPATHPLREGQIYRNHIHMLVEHGRFWTASPRPKHVRKRAAGRCFRNSAAVLQNQPVWYYCEGYATAQSMTPIHHGWLVDEDGLVIDPTWNNGTAYFGVVIDRCYVDSFYKVKEGMGNGILDDWKREIPILSTVCEKWLPTTGPYSYPLNEK